MSALYEKIKLEETEAVLKMVRRHWFIPTTRIGTLLFTAILPALLFPILIFYLGDNLNILFNWNNWIDYLIFTYAGWLLLHVMTIAYTWTDWYLDLWIITDRRIIAINQQQLFNRQVGSFRLERLQDMNIEIKGLIATFLNYGHIEAQTASGSEEEFQAKYLPDPRELKALILRCSDKRMQAMRTGHPDQTSW